MWWIQPSKELWLFLFSPDLFPHEIPHWSNLRNQSFEKIHPFLFESKRRLFKKVDDLDFGFFTSYTRLFTWSIWYEFEDPQWLWEWLNSSLSSTGQSPTRTLHSPFWTHHATSRTLRASFEGSSYHTSRLPLPSHNCVHCRLQPHFCIKALGSPIFHLKVHPKTKLLFFQYDNNHSTLIELCGPIWEQFRNCLNN